MYRIWPEAEENKLKKKYAKTPNKELAKEFNRTVDSIKSKASELELTKDYFNTKPKEDFYVLEHFCDDCLEDKEECCCNIENCLNEAGVYLEELKKEYIVILKGSENDG